MVIRYPGMFPASRELLRTLSAAGEQHFKKYRRVCVELDQDVVWFAPRWIAWLYRWLPASMGVDFRSWKKHDSFFLLWMQGPRWAIGLRRKAGDFRWPMLCVTLGGWHGYLPWGAKFILARAYKS